MMTAPATMKDTAAATSHWRTRLRDADTDLVASMVHRLGSSTWLSTGGGRRGGACSPGGATTGGGAAAPGSRGATTGTGRSGPGRGRGAGQSAWTWRRGRTWSMAMRTVRASQPAGEAASWPCRHPLSHGVDGLRWAYGWW